MRPSNRSCWRAYAESAEPSGLAEERIGDRFDFGVAADKDLHRNQSSTYATTLWVSTRQGCNLEHAAG